MIREDRIEETVQHYNAIIAPENLVPHAVAVGNDKDALRQKYENALQNPNKVFFVGHASPYTVFDDPRTGEQVGRLTVQDMHDFADEIKAIQNRCPHLQRLPPSIHREDGQALYAEWMIDIPMPQEVLQEALDWLRVNAGVMIQRDVMQDAIIGNKDYGLSGQQRVDLAQKMVELVENEGLADNTGAFRLVKRLAEEADPVMMDMAYPVKKAVQAKPNRYAVARPVGNRVYFNDYLPDRELVQPVQAPPPPQLMVGGVQELEDAYQRMQVQLNAVHLQQALRAGVGANGNG